MILYKYYSPAALGEERFSTLQNKQFYYSSVAQLNDPFDLYGGRCIVTQYKIVRHWLNIIYNVLSAGNDISLEKRNRSATEILLHILRYSFQYASCSFSRVPSDRLMWAHYAGANKGFCLEFEFPDNADVHKVLYVDSLPNLTSVKKDSNLDILSDIDNNIKQKIQDGIFSQDKTPILDHLAHIKIIQELPFTTEKRNFIEHIMDIWNPGSSVKKQQSAEFFQYLFAMSDTSHQTIIDERLVKLLLCLKAQEWCYEQEERMITKLPLSQEGKAEPWGTNVVLRKIILGCNFNMDTINSNLEILKSISFDGVYEVKPNFDALDLSIVKSNRL